MKNTLNLIKVDIKYGIFKKIYWYVIPIAIVLYTFFFLSKNKSVSEISVFEILLEIYFGIPVVSSEQGFSFPILFITYMIIPFIITSYYPFNDFDERGKVIFTRLYIRDRWWSTKCLWNFMSIILYQMIILVTAFFIKAINGISKIDDIFIPDISKFDTVMYIWIVPTITIVSLSIFQMVLSMMLEPIYGILVQIILLILSLFIYTPILPTNFLMIGRSHLYNKDGFSYILELTVCLALLIFSIFIGKLIIKRKDIL